LIHPLDALTVKFDGYRGEQGDIEGYNCSGLGIQYEVAEYGKMV